MKMSGGQSFNYNLLSYQIDMIRGLDHIYLLPLRNSFDIAEVKEYFVPSVYILGTSRLVPSFVDEILEPDKCSIYKVGASNSSHDSTIYDFKNVNSISL